MIKSSIVKKLIDETTEKYGYSLLELSSLLGVTEAAVSRWNNNKAIPSKRNFKKLKQLAEGKLEDLSNNKKSTNTDDIENYKHELELVKQRLTKLEGFIEGLKTAQGIQSYR